MLTYSFENKNNESLYEYLYKQIKKDILEYKLSPNEKLPSKRAFAKHLNISTITVENAYNQLCAEGYIYSIPKSGFYVCDISATKPRDINKPLHENPSGKKNNDFFADLVTNSTISATFPFSTWTKILRETMSDDATKLMVSSPSAGVYELRVAIADYLYQFRGMNVEPEQIIIGAGTEYLYSLLIQLLGRDKTYAIENPGYKKLSKIYTAQNVKYYCISLDENGIDTQELINTGADILHISPSHHFPTGIITPISKRYELLSWASKSTSNYIIEDDYDSEFRLLGKPIPTLQSIDVADKVIYMNTFSKSLTPTIRISYMVLPKSLIRKYDALLGFYSCTVSNFEQYTLAHFIERGYLEKHINRMRNYYRTLRDTILTCIRKHPLYKNVKIMEENSGLHFLLHIKTDLTDSVLKKNILSKNINISCLSEYYYGNNDDSHTLVVNYSGLDINVAEEAIERLYSGIFM
jgi:GntR family transcriptional regulator/MocR family aminotransferase